MRPSFYIEPRGNTWLIQLFFSAVVKQEFATSGLLFIDNYSFLAIVKQEADTSGLPFTPNFNGTRGFYMQLLLNGGDDRTTDHLPPKYVKVVRNKNVLSCTTEDLVIMNTLDCPPYFS